jgi:hypothetical protein
MKSLSGFGIALLVMALLIFAPDVHSRTSGKQEFYQLTRLAVSWIIENIFRNVSVTGNYLSFLIIL